MQSVDKKTSIFNKYSQYYDLLYKDKDYKGETDYIESLINKYSQNQVKTILDLGCGTGRHDSLLTERGYTVTGIDLSEQMIEIARKNESEKLHFQVGDVRNIQLENRFDAVISLFHVASYQTTNSDLLNYFATARKHLNENGVFIFDFWYGSAVLTDRPTVRIKKKETNEISVIRLTQPEMFPNENKINVNFETLIEDKQTKQIERITETHTMRYLFLPELELLLNQTGFKIESSFQWLTAQPLGFESWYGVVVAKGE